MGHHNQLKQMSAMLTQITLVGHMAIIYNADCSY